MRQKLFRICTTEISNGLHELFTTAKNQYRQGFDAVFQLVVGAEWPSESCSVYAAKANTSSDVLIPSLMRPTVIIEADPVADEAASMLQCFEAMSMAALFF
ncbi:hypothetical protein RB25_25250 [Herbaspirillum rubrisubalbicans]|nr:hypothetical protein RB25_25250 [Herbaspirillum rubrisubalbicans]